MQAVIQAYNEGRIGRLRYITGSDKGYYAGYGLMNMGFHVISYLCRLTGRCRSIAASGVTGGHPVTPQDVVTSPSGNGHGCRREHHRDVAVRSQRRRDAPAAPFTPPTTP